MVCSDQGPGRADWYMRVSVGFKFGMAIRWNPPWKASSTTYAAASVCQRQYCHGTRSRRGGELVWRTDQGFLCHSPGPLSYTWRSELWGTVLRTAVPHTSSLALSRRVFFGLPVLCWSVLPAHEGIGECRERHTCAATRLGRHSPSPASGRTWRAGTLWRWPSARSAWGRTRRGRWRPCLVRPFTWRCGWRLRSATNWWCSSAHIHAPLTWVAGRAPSPEHTPTRFGTTGLHTRPWRAEPAFLAAHMCHYPQLLHSPSVPRGYLVPKHLLVWGEKHHVRRSSCHNV